jgi:mannose-6-phosphate isomerase-like protein (cupin superfamily)
MNTRKQLVHRSSGTTEPIQQLGPYKIEPLLTEDQEAAATVYRVRVEPHQQTTTSYHRVAEEFYFVLTGTGTAVLDGESRAVKPGDFLRLPPGTRHAFVTFDEPLEMLDIHVPGCRPDRDTYFVDDPQGN